MKQLDLSGRLALVTGGAGQLGRTICRGLAECGANVVVCYYSQQAYAAELALGIAQDYGVKALALRADVTDRDSVQALHAEVKKQMGTVDILVNCAVIEYAWTTVLQQNPADYEGQLQSCVMQAVHMCQAFVPDMVAQNYGRVVAINTECAMQNFECQSAYVAGKRGMDGVYRVLAREVGKNNVTVNQVAPGWVVSDNCRNPEPAARNTAQNFPYISAVPMHRRGTDADIANAVCFLASPLADFITGVYLPVAGGNVMPAI